MKTFITKNSKETQQLASGLAGKIKKGVVIALQGDLGSGKTTFTQGLLRGLKIKGPYTSPTFLIIKNYQKKIPISKSPACQSLALAGRQFPNKSQKIKSKIQNIYHIDAYRIASKDILNLGWKELVAEKNNIIIIEWADRIRKIIPKNALWIRFENISPPRVDKRFPRVEAGENERKIKFMSFPT